MGEPVACGGCGAASDPPAPMPRRSVPIPLGDSTLGVTAFNVGMISAGAYEASGTRDEKVATLAGHVSSWLRGEGPAVVGLNEIHTLIAGKLRAEVQKWGLVVDMAELESNCLLWRTP